MKKTRAILAGVLAAALCLSVTGCGKDQTVVKADGCNASAAIYVMGQLDAVSNASSEPDYDSELEDIWENEIDGQSLEDWVNEQALDICRRYVAVTKLFADQGLTLSDDDQSTIESYMSDSYPTYEDFYTSVGVGESSYEAYLTFNYQYQQMFLARYQEGGEEAVSDDELHSWYKENYDEVKLISFSYTAEEETEDTEDTDAEDTDTEDTEDTDSEESVRATAQGYVDRANAGEDMDQLIYEYAQTSSSSATLNDSVDNITVISANENLTSYSDTVLEEMRAVEAGQAALVQDSENSVFYLVYQMDQESNTEYYDENTDNILFEMKADDFDQYLEDYADNEMNASVRGIIQSRYSCKKAYETKSEFMQELYSQYLSSLSTSTSE